MVALTMPVLAGALGLALDVGTVYLTRRTLQNAADAAASAAALEVKRGNPDGAQQAAQDAAARNGVDESTGAQITVNHPPQSGPKAGDDDFVEVVISEEEDGTFMGALQAGAVSVPARAVAGVLPVPTCVYALNPTANNALQLSSGASLDLQGCAVFVNSSNAQGLKVSDSSCVNAAVVKTVGGYTGTCISPLPQTGAVPVDDPLADMDPPTFSGCDHVAAKYSLSEDGATLDPGVYCDGLVVDPDVTVYLNPGLYVIDGFDFLLKGTVIGDGVTFYLTDGSGGAKMGKVSMTSGATIMLTAPTSGPWAGILFFGDRNITNVQNRFQANSSSYIYGTLYFPSQSLDFNSNATVVVPGGSTVAIADTFSFSSGATVMSAEFGDGPVPPTTTVALAE